MRARDAEPNKQLPETNKIKVSNLPPGTSKDALTFFFENRRKTGGGEIEDVELDESDSYSAIIIFKDTSVCKRVLQTVPLVLGGKQIDVQAWCTKEKENKFSNEGCKEETIEPFCTIEIRGCNSETTNDTIEFYFENTRRSGGGEIERFERKEDAFYITFKTEDVVKEVVKRKHKIDGAILEVKRYSPTPLRNPVYSEIVLVNGLNPSTTRTCLSLFLEAKAGVCPLDVTFGHEEGTALVTFDDKIDVDKLQSILKERPLEGQLLNISKHHAPNGIIVSGFKIIPSQDLLRFYFENERQNGGGSIEKIQLNEEEETCLVFFKDHTVIRNVLERKHIIDGVRLEVNKFVQPAFRETSYDEKVLLQGINPETTTTCLSFFLELKTGVSPSRIVYGEKDGTAIVTFKEKIDINKLQSACKTTQLDASYLSALKVPVINSILVSGFESLSQDTLQFYFENTRRSGGGNIEKIQFNKNERNCLIFFEDQRVLDKVCKRKHIIDGQKLTLRVYHEFLGQIPDDGEGSATGGAIGGASGGGGIKFKQPEPYIINDADKRKVEFLKHSKSVKDAVEKQLKTCHATIQWPARKTDPVIIHCDLTPDVKYCKTLAKTWKKTATENLNKFLDALIVEEHIALQEAWIQVMEGLQSMTITHPDGVAVIIERDNCKIILVGYKHIVKTVSDQVKQIIKKVGEKLDRKKQQMTEKVKVKYHQLRLLMITHFPEKMGKKFQGFVVKLDIKSLEVTFSGLGSEITAVKIEMYETFYKIVIAKVGQFSQEKINFYDSKQVREYLDNTLEIYNIVAVWEIEKQRNIMMYAMSDTESVQACHIFQQSVVETPVSLKPESVYLLQSQLWNDNKQEVENIEPGLIKVVPMPDQQKIIVFTTIENVGTCRELVEDFLTFNTVSEKVFSLSSGEMRFLQQHHKKEITSIANDLKDDQVKISIDNVEIRIKGTSTGLKTAQKRIDDIVQKIVKKHHTFNKPGMAKYIGTEEGQVKLRKVETMKKCTIISSGSGDSDEDINKAIIRKGWHQEHAGGYKRDGGQDGGKPKDHNKNKGQTDTSAMKIGSLELKIYQGDITMAETDVIVNSSNSEIDLSRGAVAQAISKKGGRELQQQVKLQVPTMKKEGIAVTKSGSGPMPYKYIIHINAEDAKKDWKSKILKSLKKAEEMMLSSVAFPALETGQGFGGQMSDKADNLFDAVVDFENSPHKHLKEIHIVIFQSTMVNDFQAEIQKCISTKPDKNKGFFQRLGDFIFGSSEEKEPKTEPKKPKEKQRKDQPKTSSEEPLTLTVVIYADSHKTVNEAVKMIEELIEKEFQTKVFEDRIIKEFSPAQKTAVHALVQYGIDVKYEERIGRIQLFGLTADLLNAADSIRKLILEAKRNKQTDEEASLVSGMVQWYCIEITKKGTELTPYPKNGNLIIERAYRESKSIAVLCDIAETEYIIDFSSYKAFPAKNPTDTVEVIRRKLIKVTTFEPPSNWSAMKDTENVTIITLSNTDTEYQTLIQSFELSSGSKFTIVKVERIQNRTLYQQYVAKKKLMDGQNKAVNNNEHTLWHGTTRNAKDSINAYGFNRSYCGITANSAYGKGVYFEEMASYSCQTTQADSFFGCRYVYQCKVLTGEYTLGNHRMREPPAKANHILYDSVVDSLFNPQRYIIFNDTQAYPEYLITFT